MYSERKLKIIIGMLSIGLMLQLQNFAYAVAVAGVASERFYVVVAM